MGNGAAFGAAVLGGLKVQPAETTRRPSATSPERGPSTDVVSLRAVAPSLRSLPAGVEIQLRVTRAFPPRGPISGERGVSGRLILLTHAVLVLERTPCNADTQVS